MAAEKTGALWAPGGQIESQNMMILLFLLVFVVLLSIILMMSRYHLVWTWPPWLGRHAPPGCWSARQRCSSHWWPFPRPATSRQPRPGEEAHRAQLAEWPLWMIFPTTIIRQKGKNKRILHLETETKNMIKSQTNIYLYQDQDHCQDQHQDQDEHQVQRTRRILTWRPSIDCCSSASRCSASRIWRTTFSQDVIKIKMIM